MFTHWLNDTDSFFLVRFFISLITFVVAFIYYSKRPEKIRTIFMVVFLINLFLGFLIMVWITLLVWFFTPEGRKTFLIAETKQNLTKN